MDVVFGLNLPQPTDPVTFADIVVTRMKKIYEQAIKSQEQMRMEYIHRSKGEIQKYDVGNFVLIWKPADAVKAVVGKLKMNWSGPFVIVERYSDTHYGILTTREEIVKVNVNRMCRYNPFAGWHAWKERESLL